MVAQHHGALGATFSLVRLLQVVSLIGIIGMTANFVSEMVSANSTPPNVLIGTLSVVRGSWTQCMTELTTAHEQTCIAVLYCAITFILYLDNLLPFLINLGTDGLCLIAVTVVAVTVGKPLSYMNCQIDSASSGDSNAAYDFTANIGHNLNQNGGSIDYGSWAGADKTTCLEMKSIWGLSIALWYVKRPHDPPLPERPPLTRRQHPLRLFHDVQLVPVASQQGFRSQGHGLDSRRRWAAHGLCSARRMSFNLPAFVFLPCLSSAFIMSLSFQVAV